MVSEQQLTQKLELIGNYIEIIDDEILGRNEEEVTIEGVYDEVLRGHRAISDQTLYIVGGRSDREYLSVLYFYTVTQSVANQIPENSARSIIDHYDHPEDVEDASFEAAKLLLNDTSSEKMNEFENKLYATMSHGSVEVSLNSEHSGFLSGFYVEHKIFPFGTSYDLSEFNSVVQSVNNAGSRGATLVRGDITVNVDRNKPENTNVTINNVR
ncbi:hypothetical protein [Halococcus hamelinensis]|uniref:hypothetical protein n=1 Tax=Halococcus hamelinensis TaxID=332168 RepID=UPI000AF377C4|nr:hypothetical protein [Halococcus hamelinensis]